MVAQFETSNCLVIGASTDSRYFHKEWTMKDRKKGGIGEMNIPLLADSSHRISKAYGALIDNPADDADGVTMRAICKLTTWRSKNRRGIQIKQLLKSITCIKRLLKINMFTPA